MKLLLFADGIVGENIALFLIENFAQDITLLVTTVENDIYREAQRNGITVCVFDSEKNVLNRLTEEVDLGVLAWWPKIIRKPLLNVPLRGFINTHPSFLPFNRGKHFNFWALVEQTPFGVSLHQVEERVDTGGVIAQSVIGYDWIDTGGSLYKKSQKEMLDLFIKTYPTLRNERYEIKPQDLTIGSFHRASEIEAASKIELASNYNARFLLNLLRARTFDGYPGCWFEDNGSRYEISVNIKKVK